jgi:nondiscriminating glutamyl-tRNA synthetase
VSPEASDDSLVNPRVRFAPSPTGKLHLGSARTALFNWLVARGNGGAMVLRLEDTDLERSSPEFERDIIDSLQWMGIDWDEGPDVGGAHGPYRQSERMAIYKEYADGLLESGKAYRCYCTPWDLEERKKAVIEAGGAWRYDRKCLQLEPSEVERLQAKGAPYTVRFRVPAGTVTVDDMLRGAVNVDSSEIDDFIIQRSDGSAGFHLAVVVDDITMQITHVIRGDDHLTNAVRHVLLFKALGSQVPRFLHHSLLMGPDGAKLSKRHGATAVSDYREQGYLPEALNNYLALLSWSPGDDREVFSLGDLVREFSIRGVSASKAIFDFDKLNWLDRQHMKKLSDSQVTDLVVPFLEREGRSELLTLPREKLELAVESVRNGMEKLSDAVGPTDIYVRPAGLIEDKAMNELRRAPELQEALVLCLEALESAGPRATSRETAERVVEDLRSEAKERGWGAKKVLWPFRLAVTGLTVGPDLVYLIMFWGTDGCAERVEATRRTLEAASG